MSQHRATNIILCNQYLWTTEIITSLNSDMTMKQFEMKTILQRWYFFFFLKCCDIKQCIYSIYKTNGDSF